MHLPANSIPDPAWRGRMLLATTRLRILFSLPDVHRALTQDALMAEITPVLRTPDLLEHEQSLLSEWGEERPEAAAVAAASATKIEQACRKLHLPPDAEEYRVRLHLAAHRRLDASMVGDEVCAPCHWFMGEPHIDLELSDDTTLRVGNTRLANYYGSAAKSAASIARLANPLLIAEVEAALFPPTPPDDLREFAARYAQWREMDDMRLFEVSQKYPLFPRSLPMPFSDAAPPPGYLIRFDQGVLREVGADLSTVSLAGFSPYLAISFAEYCRKHTERLEALMQEVGRLSLDHLVRHLRDVQVEAWVSPMKAPRQSRRV